MKKYWQIILLLSLSLTTHLFFFGYPNEAVFDEVYFTTYPSAYLTGEYYFDPHPPLSKLIYGFAAHILNLEPISSISIGDPLPDGWILIRLIPLIAGLLLPLVVYLLCRQFKLSQTSSLVVGLLIVLESSLLVHSRFVLLDSLLMFFGFLGLLLYFTSRQKQLFWLKILSVISLTCAFSIKWTAGTFIFIALLVEIYDLYKKYSWKKVGEIIVLFFVLPLIIYVSTFAIHFNLLNKSGQGDPFMSEDFQKTLEGNPNFERSDLRVVGFVEKFLELNVTMYGVNADFDAPHQYGSKWYSWPVMHRTIFYWQGDQSYIYLFGNPFIYLLSLYSVVTLLILFALKDYIQNKKLALLVLFGYFLNFLPFILIERVMFLYHYHTALVFAIITIAILLDLLPKKRVIAASAIVLCSTLTFLYFSPLYYGLHVPEERMPKLFIFNSWR